eukprot:c26844_g1_i2 orf=117-1259(+)
MPFPSSSAAAAAASSSPSMEDGLPHHQQQNQQRPPHHHHHHPSPAGNSHHHHHTSPLPVQSHGPSDPLSAPNTTAANNGNNANLSSNPMHNHALSLSLPLHVPSTSTPPRGAPSKPFLNGIAHHPPIDRLSREDCWSEGATNTLIDVWGDRYLELNRGNLKQKHWKEVADAVNARENGNKPHKTDVQCKNRLDTLKKKYKLEKSKIVTGGGPSKWPFYERLDELIGPSKKPNKPLLIRSKTNDNPLDEEIVPKPVLQDAINDNNIANNNTTTDTCSNSKESPDMTDSCPGGLTNAADGKAVKKRRLFDSPFKDLAHAILKFAEIYERIESSKQRQLIDLEKQRMEFAKELELKRMQLFMQTQVELAKMKHGKNGNTEHYL